MTLFEIILFGYAVNFIVFILMILIMLGNMLINLKNPTQVTNIMELEKIKHRLDSVKTKLLKKKISIKTQSDFIIFFPFALIIDLLSMIFYAVNGRMYDWFAVKALRKINLLEKRLKKNL